MWAYVGPMTGSTSDREGRLGRPMHTMNPGQQSCSLVSTVSILNSLDDASREKVLSELPEEIKCRLVAEQHAARKLAAATLNLNPNSAQHSLANGFLNLYATHSAHAGSSVTESILNHNISLLKAPVTANLTHSIPRTSAVGGSYNAGVRAAGASSHNHGAATLVHHITARIPGSGINSMGSNPLPVNGTNGVISSSHSPGVRVSGASHSVNPGPLGTGFNLSLGSRGSGASTSHSFNPRAVGMAHTTSSMSGARQLGATTSPMNMPTGLLPSNSIHLTSAHRFSSIPGTFPPGMNGHLLRHRPMISTYLDDFKQGFPSKGLSVVSNRWWGSAVPDKTVESVSGGEVDASGCMESNPGRSGPSLNVSQTEYKEANEVVKSFMKVSRSRKRVAASSKRALQLGVTKGYGVQKLGHKEAALLQYVFGDSLPRRWLATIPPC